MSDFSISGEITLNSKGFTSGLENAKGMFNDFKGKFSDVSGKISQGTKNWGLDLNKFYDKGSSMFKSFGLDIDKFAGKFGVKGKLVAAIAVAVSALFKLGDAMDQLTKQIALGTGATGQALDELQLTAESAMINGVGRSTEEVGKLVANLNTRFNVTGSELERMTKEFDSFASVTGGNVADSVNTVADIMARWNISTEDSKKLLDQMTVAGQQSGISISELSNGLKQGQNALSQFGFNTTQSIALLSSFKKNGIDTSVALNGMKVALANFAKQGVNSSEAFKKISDEIKNASSNSEALSIAVNTFGTRAGPEMVKALRDGSVSIEDFTEQLRNAGGAMQRTDEASRTTKDAMNDLKASLMGTFGEFGQGISQLFKGIIDTVRNFVSYIGPVIQPIGYVFKTVFKGVADLITWFSSELVRFQKNNGKVWNHVVRTLNSFAKGFKKIFDNVIGIFKNVFGFIFSIIGGKWEEAWINMKLIGMRVAKLLIDAISGIANGFIGMVNGLLDGLKGLSEAYNKVADFFNWNRWELNIRKIDDLDLAERLGLNSAIDEAEARLRELRGDIENIGDLGEVDTSYTDLTLGTSSTGLEGGSASANQTSTSWQQKRLQQQLDAITKEKEEKLKALAEEGTAQQELDRINQEYADLQLELYQKIANLKKQVDLDSVSTLANAEEEKSKLIEYYTQEELEKRKEYYTNDISAKKVAEEKKTEISTEWDQKILQQRLNGIQENMKLELAQIENTKENEKKIYEIKKKYVDRQIALIKTLNKMKLEEELKSAKSEADKEKIRLWYANDTADKIKEVEKNLSNDITEETIDWKKKFVEVMKTIGNGIATAFSKVFNGVKTIFSKVWEFMQLDPSEALDTMLEFSDKIQTFFVETLPNLPAFFEAGINIITSLLSALTEPKTLNMIVTSFVDMMDKVINLIINNLPNIIRSIARLIGPMIKGLINIIANINWLEVLRDVAVALWDAFVELITNLFSGIGDVLMKVWNSIGEWFSNLWGGITDWFGHLGNWFSGKGWATGTNNAPAGLSLVGERGPELIDLHGGERIYNAENTRDILSNASGGGNNFNVTFNNVQDTSAYTMMKQLKSYQREMAINGIV